MEALKVEFGQDTADNTSTPVKNSPISLISDQAHGFISHVIDDASLPLLTRAPFGGIGFS